MVSVPATYGAILLGGFLAAALSGIVTVQSFIYIKLYPTDLAWRKAMVAVIWILDGIHTALVCASIWIYLIKNFGDTSKINDIPETVAMTIALTANLDVHRSLHISRSVAVSRGDWRITAPLLVLAFLRLCSACVTTAEMIHLNTFSEFKREFRWVFTLGLALSSLVDILIAIFLCYSLRTTRKASSSMDYVINSVILYTFENNSLTSAATVVSMICWLVMPSNLIFMGLHFVISKLYANSLLATLNARKQLRQERAQRGLSGELPLAFPGLTDRFRSNRRDSSRMEPIGTKLEINVEKTVEYEVDADTLNRHSPALSSPNLSCHPSQAVSQMV
ncbi:uncharacterized protein EDB91DRAFT_1247492 [Suillus paluster]|uniref:uncharacterized protein n=1 Tax=Suillus paluster TaxID=48578 RepID=UPI001B8775C0|nr:uncharacterized protein EDB91DRAFT_1247492 [Suillus paluster]KAG1742682.1 hypothetical protein EDB91DRAFT_1247492 [Suillus paluster]